MKANPADGQAKAGKIMGMVITIIEIVVIVAVVILAIMGVAASFAFLGALA